MRPSLLRRIGVDSVEAGVTEVATLRARGLFPNGVVDDGYPGDTGISEHEF